MACIVHHCNADGSRARLQKLYLVRVSFTMRETVPLVSCLWLLSAISAYMQQRHTHMQVDPRLTATLLLAMQLTLDFDFENNHVGANA